MGPISPFMSLMINARPLKVETTPVLP